MKVLTNGLRKAGTGAVIALGALAANQAIAAPLFMVNPNSNGLATNGTQFSATAINGFSSAHISYTGVGFIYQNESYILFNGFSLNGSPVSAGDSRANLDYGLYARVHQTIACTGLLGPGVSCAPTVFSAQLIADPGDDNVYNQAALGVDPSINQVGNQVVLANVTTSLGGVAGIDALGGAYQNITTDFTLTDEGKLYFVDPVPFYLASFAAFNNTSSGIRCDTANCVNALDLTINQEAGILDFTGQVPEPGVLGLLGIGLLGMAGVHRRKQQ